MNKIWPYQKVTLSFADAISPTPLLNIWNTNLLEVNLPDAGLGFTQTIKYIYNSKFYEHQFRCCQQPDPMEEGIWPKADIQSHLWEISDEGVYTTISNIRWKCYVNSDGSLNLSSLETINYSGTQEDGTTTVSSAIIVGSKFKTGNLPNLDMVWHYNETLEDYFWYHPDDALELKVAGGGRYKQRIIMFGNGKIYFSEDL